MVALIETLYKETKKPRETYKRQPLVQERLSALELRLEPVQNSKLIPGTAGHVNMNTGRGIYGAEFQDPFSTNTQHHEFAHILGIRDEHQADIWALYKTGKPEYVRGPFYKPPINLN
ncbi:MAG: hypothetical protein ABH864_02695 [archaeon]